MWVAVEQHGLIQDAHCRPGQFCSNLPPSELLVHCPTVEVRARVPCGIAGGRLSLTRVVGGQGEEEEMYFGLHRSTFDGQSGFTDFLVSARKAFGDAMPS